MAQPSLFDKAGEFEQAVKAARGKVVLLVHPFAHFFTPDKPDEAYQESLWAFLKNKKGPVIVLEEGQRLENTRNTIKSSGFFYVPTIRGGPMPTDGYDKLHTLLRKAGVKTVLIGGLYAGDQRAHVGVLGSWGEDVVREYEQKHHNPATNIVARGCVGQTYKNMIEERYEKVRLIPSMIWPHRPCHERRNK